MFVLSLQVIFLRNDNDFEVIFIVLVGLLVLNIIVFNFYFEYFVLYYELRMIILRYKDSLKFVNFCVYVGMLEFGREGDQFYGVGMIVFYVCFF